MSPKGKDEKYADRYPEVKSDQFKEFIDELMDYSKDHTDEQTGSMGDRIRSFCKIHNISIDSFSQITHLDTDALSNIESRKTYPSLHFIHKKFQDLEDVSRYLGKKKDEGYKVLRKNDMKEIPHGKRGLSDTAHLQKLAVGGDDPGLNSYIITLDESSKDAGLSSHSGEEFILVLKGKIKITLDEREETLEEGDSINYNSTIPHRVVNAADTESMILAVVNKSSG